MKSFLDRIRNGETLLSDGALGTMLIQRGMKSGECPDLWNLVKPEILREIARLYIDAGADIISTNNFGGHPLKLAQYSLDHKAGEINTAAVKAIRDIIPESRFLAISCGPCGKLMKPYGDTDPDDVYRGYADQLSDLIQPGVDVLFFETMIDVSEAVLGIKAAKSVAPDVPICATMTYDETPRGFFTVMGNSIEQSADLIAEAGADITGSNCGNGIEKMVRIAREFKKFTELPVLIQSNAGLPVVRGETLTYPESPEFMAESVIKLLDMGVNIIGGCCGTTPDHIKAFRKTIDSYHK